MKNKWMMGLTAVGGLLLAFGASGMGTPQPHPGGTAASRGLAGGQSASSATLPGETAVAAVEAFDAYEERQLAGLVDSIAGVQDALVVVTAATTTGEKLGMDVTTSRQSSNQAGGAANAASSSTTTTTTSNQVVTVQQASGGTVPVVVQQQMPQIVGVVVVARSADPVRMQVEVTQAVANALGIPDSEVTVLERK